VLEAAKYNVDGKYGVNSSSEIENLPDVIMNVLILPCKIMGGRN